MLYRVRGGARSAAGALSAGLLLTKPFWLIADRLAQPAATQVPFRPPLPLRPLSPRSAQDRR